MALPDVYVHHGSLTTGVALQASTHPDDNIKNIHAIDLHINNNQTV